MVVQVFLFFGLIPQVGWIESDTGYLPLRHRVEVWEGSRRDIQYTIAQQASQSFALRQASSSGTSRLDFLQLLACILPVHFNLAWVRALWLLHLLSLRSGIQL